MTKTAAAARHGTCGEQARQLAGCELDQVLDEAPVLSHLVVELISGVRHQAFRLRGLAQTLNSSGWSRRASDSAIKASPSAAERLPLTSPR
jgi:hypothetical protein